MKLSIAPMVDWSYTPFRVWMKMLAPEALCYTEMHAAQAVIHAPDRTLHYDPRELPKLAFQVGGHDPALLAKVADAVASAGFSEINFNLGCPSPRVRSGQFGACLMLDPDRVMQGIVAMKRAVSIPVSAKIRIGVDHHDSYDFVFQFVARLLEHGCDKIIVHARKAWLSGLSPKQNRTIPPVNYETVYALKRDFPEACIILNGNLSSLEVHEYLTHVDGIMFGRLACDDPYQIAKIHHALYPHHPLLMRSTLLEQYKTYIQTTEQRQTLRLLLKPILNIGHGLPYHARFKSYLLQLNDVQDEGGWQVCFDHLNLMESASSKDHQ